MISKVGDNRAVGYLGYPELVNNQGEVSRVETMSIFGPTKRKRAGVRKPPMKYVNPVTTGYWLGSKGQVAILMPVSGSRYGMWKTSRTISGILGMARGWILIAILTILMHLHPGLSRIPIPRISQPG